MMEKHLVKVEGHPSLARNKNSGAIVNINKSSINQARIAKIAKKKNEDQLNSRISNLENKVDKLLDILQEVVKNA